MKNENYNIVMAFISKECNVNMSNISENTSLSDMGLDGDDVSDFLVKFFNEFGIDYEQTNYSDFIPKEARFFTNTFLSFLGKGEKSNNDEIFVKDLIISLDKKKWYKNSEH